MFSVLEIFISSNFIKNFEPEYSPDDVFSHYVKMQGLKCPVGKTPNICGQCLKQACSFRDSVSNKKIGKKTPWDVP